MSEHVEGN